jgi:hypothetical protein
MTAEEVFRECLRALQARGQPSRSEAAQAGSFERIRHARHERRLRADDRQRDLFAAREVDQRRGVVRGDIDVDDALLERRPGVAGSNVDLLHARGLRDFPGERVLAAAAAEDENFHGSK